MKKLMEGLGCNLNVKFVHSFTGFVDAYMLITCNALCCPFIEPPCSTLGFSREEFLLDNEAMMRRTNLIEFTKKFEETNLVFDKT